MASDLYVLGNAVITVADVNAQDSLTIYEEKGNSTIITLITFLVPRCNFPHPNEVINFQL